MIEQISSESLWNLHPYQGLKCMLLCVLDVPIFFAQMSEIGRWFRLFPNRPTQKSLSGLAFCLGFRVNITRLFRANDGDQCVLLSRSAEYCVLFSVHSCIHVLLGCVKRLHILLNLIQGGKNYWHPCRKKALYQVLGKIWICKCIFQYMRH